MIEAYPLYWPEDRKRTHPTLRCKSAFSGSFADIRKGVCDELDRMGATNVIISSNIPLRADGLPRAGVHNIPDPGIAVYFKDQDGQEMCFACDKYVLTWENLRAIQRTIEAIRGIERWGSSDMMQRAFRGFKALPERVPQSWRDTLGFSPHENVSMVAVDEAFKQLAKQHHPDQGGDPDLFRRLILARDNARRDLEREPQVREWTER